MNNNIWNVTKHVCLGLGLFVVVGMMMVMFLKAVLPVDEEYEANLPMIEENAKKRLEGFKQMQEEAKCGDYRFSQDNCE